MRRSVGNSSVQFASWSRVYHKNKLIHSFFSVTMVEYIIRQVWSIKYINSKILVSRPLKLILCILNSYFATLMIPLLSRVKDSDNNVNRVISTAFKTFSFQIY